MTSLMVDDQTKALRFYTEVLGFTKKHDIPVGEYRWITVTGDGRDEVELALEPNANPAGKAFQEAMFAQGIPLAAFEVSDIRAEFSRLTSHGVAAGRLETRSYGEERPKHDNSREETRRLNRRAALVVRVQ